MIRRKILIICVLFVLLSSSFSMIILANSKIIIFASARSDPPKITISFAGNHGDSGGPKYLPPNETGPLADSGYFTNDSYQDENFINITCQITDDGTVSIADLHLWDVTASSWDNSTYSFIRIGSTDEWFCNATGLISGHKYSFDVKATDDELQLTTELWRKTGIGGGITRRYVTVGGTPKTVTYFSKNKYLSLIHI